MCTCYQYVTKIHMYLKCAYKNEEVNLLNILMKIDNNIIALINMLFQSNVNILRPHACGHFIHHPLLDIG